jgi:hypothetical protein
MAQRFPISRVGTGERRVYSRVGDDFWALPAIRSDNAAVARRGGATSIHPGVRSSAVLAVSERCVEGHLTAIFERAQVETRAELAARVWRG